MNYNESWGDLNDFVKTRTKSTGPNITISKHGVTILSIGFLRAAKDQILNKTHVTLSYSKAKNAIVFGFTGNESFPGAIKMTVRDKVSNSSNASISTRSFFANYGISIEKYAGRYTAKLEDIPGRGLSWVLYLPK